MLEYNKETNKEHKETLESKIVHTLWFGKIACVGSQLGFEVWTHFVGNGSEIEIKVEDKRGKTIDKIKGKVYGDFFGGSLVVPEKAKEELSFIAKLPKHGLEMKSNILKVIPSVKVANLKWGQKEARRGDIVKLTADIKGVLDETKVIVSIYEYDADGAHDFISKFPCRVKNKKIETEWEYEYHEDTDEIPTNEEMQRYGNRYNPPEYFWVAEIAGKRFGKEQESGLLKFIDDLEVTLVDGEGNPIGEKEYEIELPDGTTQSGKLDQDGYTILKDLSPGRAKITIKNQ